MNAQTSAEHELGYPIKIGMIFRKTPLDQPKIPAIVPIGATIKTNYDSGPYKVIGISKEIVMGHETYSFVCKNIENIGRCYLNEFVAVGGRILKLFGNNDDEILVIEAKGQLSLL